MSLRDETWQPIETAPKDGTQILFYGKWKPFDILPGGQDCIVITSWSTYHSHSNAQREWIGASNINADFTHWRMLPDPPSISTHSDPESL